MSDWNKINDEKVSREHRDKVMNEARGLLREHEIANPSRRWVWSGFGLALSGVAAAVLVWRSKPSDPMGLEGVEPEELAAAALDPEMLEESEFLIDLELLEELEELEQWEDS